MVTVSVSRFLLFGLLFFISVKATAQINTITGSVRSAETGETLAGSNIFFDGTTIGVQADSAGNFTIKNIPDGTYALVISFIGFKTFTTKLSFPNPAQSQVNVSLSEKTTYLYEVTVEADTKEWQRNLKKFEKHFLGYTRNADDTEILNPEVLNFGSENGDFIAKAEEPLQIENKALGYSINFYLDKFIFNGQTIRTNGHSEFSLMKTEDIDQREDWRDERKRAYNGSFRHFINTLVNGSLRDNNFKIQFSNSLRNNTDIHNKFTSSDRPEKIEFPDRLYLYSGIGEIEFSFHKKFEFLRVDYFEEQPERDIAKRAGYNPYAHQVSYIKLPNAKAVIDLRSGTEIAPYRASLYGYWGWSSRLPDLLPKDYDPSSK